MISISQLTLDHAPLPDEVFTFRAGNGKFTLIDHSEGARISLTVDELITHIAMEMCDDDTLPTQDDLMLASNIVAHSGKNAIPQFMWGMLP